MICDRVMLYSAVNYFTQRVTTKKVEKFVFRDTSNSPYPGDISFYEDGKLQIMDKKNRKKYERFFYSNKMYVVF